MNIKKLSEEECLEIMDDFLYRQDEPKVGIFWYDPAEQELFGVSSTGISDLKGATIQKLHKDYWAKEHKKKHKGIDIGRYAGNYADTPRGRIFYFKENEEFVVKTGRWIDDYPEAKELIIEEFDLQNSNVRFELGIHWELGHGYEG